MRLFRSLLAVAALAACQKPAQAPRNEVAPAADSASIKGVDRSHKGQRAPDVAFTDPDGEQTTLADLSGRPTLVNLWATWCAPCVKELPTLDRLSKGKSVQVIAISQDSGPHASVAAFLSSKAPGLEPYQDSKMALSGKLGAEVLPTSILYDAQGREVWRFVGDLDWTRPEAAKLLAEAGAPAAR